MKKIIMLLMLVVMSLGVSAAITCGESVVRSAPTQVSPGSTFQVTYTAQGASGSWGASVEDSVSGGCTFPSGSNTYKTVMLSEDGNTKTITMNAPSSGSCSFSGDYKFGTCSIGNMPSTTVTVSGGTTCTDSSWSPATSTVCSGQSYTQTSNCGNTRTATGTKDCSTTCTDSSWSPATSTVCSGQSFTQTSNCGNARTSTGTMDCSSNNDPRECIDYLENENADGSCELNIQLIGLAIAGFVFLSILK